MPQNNPIPLSAAIVAADTLYAGLHQGISASLPQTSPFFTLAPNSLAGLDALSNGANAAAVNPGDWERDLVSSNCSFLVGSAFRASSTGSTSGVMAEAGAWLGSKIGDWFFDNYGLISGNLADFGETVGLFLENALSTLASALAAGLQAFDDALADLGSQLDGLMAGIGETFEASQDQIWDWLGNPFESPPVSPLVIDLDGDGIELMSLAGSNTHFDLDIDGFRELTGWVSPDDGLLAYDINSNNTIDDISELFGNQTTDGFTELSALDSNSDGVIDANDAAFGSLLVWRDLDSDGISDQGELVSLSTAGIASINLNASLANYTLAGNLVTHHSSVTWSDAHTSDIIDAWFSNDQRLTEYVPNPAFAYHADAVDLPNLRGFGLVASLWVSLSEDAALRTDAQALQQLAVNGSYAEFLAAFESLALDWTGADAANPTGRGPYIDGQHLAFLEALYGVNWSVFENGNPAVNQGAALEGQYQAAIQSMAARYYVQSLGLELAHSSDISATLAALPINPVFLAYDFQGDRIVGHPAIVLDELLTNAGASGSPAALLDVAALFHALNMDLQIDEAAFRAIVSDHLGLTPGQYHSTFEQAVSMVFADHLFLGSDGADSLSGSVKDDALIGGLGDDSLNGGTGSDDYIYNAGDGYDVISDSGLSSVQTDRLILGAGLNAADLIVTRSTTDDDDVTLSFSGISGSIALNEQFYNGAYYQIEEIVFGDGTVWTAQDLQNAYFASVITSGNDTIIGFHSNDTIDGGAGNDIIKADVGADTLIGGLGDDDLQGGEGSDTYLYNMGDGHDTIYDTGNGPGEIDRLVFGAGLNAADIIVTRSATDLDDVTISFAGSVGSVTLNEQFYNGSFNRIEEIEFGNGTVWSAADLEAAVLAQTQTAGNDLITGFSYRADTYIYSAGQGHDVISDPGTSAAQIDRLVLGSGLVSADVDVTWYSDLGYFGLTFDGIAGSIGMNIPFGQSQGIEEIIFGDSEVWNLADIIAAASTAANSTVTGTSGADVITGGIGNDRLKGGAGGDTYVYASGDGNDVIDEDYGSGIDTLQFTDLNAADISLAAAQDDPNDLIITITATGERIRIDDQFTSSSSSNSGIDRIVFADSSIWNMAAIAAATVFDFSGTNGNDTMGGTVYADTLTGGDGNDVLNGGAGGDTYIYTSGDGNDIIDEGYASGIDVLQFADLNAADVSLAAAQDDPSDLIITIIATGETIRIDGQFTYASSFNTGIDEIRFANGTVWNMAAITAATVFTLMGTIGDDVINGTSKNEAIFGGDGNDRLSGGAGVDYFDGGAGNDTVDFTYTAGNVDINLASGLAIWPGAAPETLVSIENVNGSNGANIITGDAGDNRLFGFDGNDTIYGGAGNDFINGGSGADYLDGGDGIDTVAYDYFAGNMDIDLAAGIAGTETAVNFENAIGSQGVNVITGTSGDNLIDGQGGNDTLIGAGGNDLLTGGAGNDIFVFHAYEGHDMITDFSAGAGDVIRLEGLGITDFAGLLAAAYEDGADTVIEFDSSNSITLSGIALSSLHADDFVFV
jgi:Ca2+-binding RTX toxin-like protein